MNEQLITMPLTQTKGLGFTQETQLSRWSIVGLCASIFPTLTCLTHDGKHWDIEKKSNCFSYFLLLPPQYEYSMCGPYINTVWTHQPDREDAVSLLVGIQHFMPGVTHQPSHHSAVKCQQSQIPPPCR